MKTREQLTYQLKYFIFSEEEWQKVKKFCNERVGLGFFKSFRGRIDYDYDKFTRWFELGYGVGDIVEYGGTTGMVTYNTKGNFELCAFLNPQGKLITDIPKDISFDEANARIASQGKKNDFENVLVQNNLEMDYKTGVLTKRRSFVQGKTARFMYNNTKNTGVIKAALETSIVFYYAWDGSNLVENEVKIPLPDVLETLKESEVKVLQDQITYKKGLQWSSLNKCFIVRTQRCPRGARYFYFTDKFSITSTTDAYSLVHDTRYSMGNYFRTLEEARDFMAAIQKLRETRIKQDDHH